MKPAHMLRRCCALALLTAALAGCGGKRPQPALEVTPQQQGSGLVLYIKTTDFVVGKDGHVHVRLNGGPEAMIYGNTYTIPQIEPGRYEIFVELSNPRHESLGVQQVLEFEVK